MIDSTGGGSHVTACAILQCNVHICYIAFHNEQLSYMAVEILISKLLFEHTLPNIKWNDTP